MLRFPNFRSNAMKISLLLLKAGRNSIAFFQEWKLSTTVMIGLRKRKCFYASFRMRSRRCKRDLDAAAVVAHFLRDAFIVTSVGIWREIRAKYNTRTIEMLHLPFERVRIAFGSSWFRKLQGSCRGNPVQIEREKFSTTFSILQLQRAFESPKNRTKIRSKTFLQAYIHETVSIKNSFKHNLKWSLYKSSFFNFELVDFCWFSAYFQYAGSLKNLLFWPTVQRWCQILVTS